jgi:trans-2-enoyl-CoA reductase
MKVGQAVIQVAKKMRVKTVNFVRDRSGVHKYSSLYISHVISRPDFEAVENHLKALGATHVFPYSRLLDRSFKKEFAEFRQVRSPPPLGGVGCPDNYVG